MHYTVTAWFFDIGHWFTFNQGRRRGIPNVIMHRDNQVSPISTYQLPSPDEAVQSFESHGGHLTYFSPFATQG